VASPGEAEGHLKSRGLVLVTVVIAAVAALAAIPRTAASAAGEACPGGGRLVVNANGNYSNSADYGADGHIWALDTARESIQMWQIGTNTYCMMRHDNGTFTSFAGVSPEGTGTVRAGVTGHWSGEIVAVIQGTFAPTLPTKGFVGDFDAKCDQTGTCLGPGFNAGLYFSSITDVDYLTFSATFAGGPCGVWRQSTKGDTGDIVC